MMGSECRILRDKLIVGILKINPWKNDAYGELNGHMLTFKSKGFTQSKIIILDIDKKNELGFIDLNYWKQTAQITYQGKEFHFKFKSWLQNGWEMKGEEENASSTPNGFWGTQGTIDDENATSPLILCGLYINETFKRQVVV